MSKKTLLFIALGVGAWWLWKNGGIAKLKGAIPAGKAAIPEPDANAEASQ